MCFQRYAVYSMAIVQSRRSCRGFFPSQIRRGRNPAAACNLSHMRLNLLMLKSNHPIMLLSLPAGVPTVCLQGLIIQSSSATHYRAGLPPRERTHPPALHRSPTRPLVRTHRAEIEESTDQNEIFSPTFAADGSSPSNVARRGTALVHARPRSRSHRPTRMAHARATRPATSRPTDRRPPTCGLTLTNPPWDEGRQTTYVQSAGGSFSRAHAHGLSLN